MKKVLSLLLVCIMVLSLGTAAFAASGKWQTYNGNYYYQLADGSYAVNSWQNIDGKYYHFDSKGCLQFGWQQIGGKYYYFGANGVVRTGWQTIGGKYYYFGSDGVVRTGMQTIGGKNYYFGSDAALVLGWVNYKGYWFYFGSNGAMVTGLQKIGANYYFFNTDGTLKTGWLQSGSDWYYFKDNGAMAINEDVAGYHFGANGKCTGAAASTGQMSISAYVSNGTQIRDLTVQADPASFEGASSDIYINIRGTWVNNTQIYHTMIASFGMAEITENMIRQAAEMYPSMWGGSMPPEAMQNTPLETYFGSGFPKMSDFDMVNTYYVLALNLDQQFNYVGYTIFTITK